jgi:excisionase family DNA binding protein
MNDEGSSTTSDNDPLHNVDTIALRLNVSAKFVRRRIDSGELACYRVGRLLRVSERQYRDYLARVQRGHE